MSLYGVGLNVQVEKIQTDFRLFVSKQKGALNIRQLAAIFRGLDETRNGQIDFESFTKGLNTFGFFQKKVDYQCLQKFYCKSGDGLIYYGDFLQDVRVPLNDRRIQIVLKVFNLVDTQGKGVVTTEELGDRLEVVRNPDYQAGKKNRASIVEEFLKQFSQQEVTVQEFLQLYEDIGLGVSSDQQFVQQVCQQWGVLESDELAVTKEELRGLVKIVRQRLIQMTHQTTEEFLLRKLFKEFDINRSGLLSLEELHAMLVKLEIPVSNRFLNALFQKFDRNNSGTIEFEEFVTFVLNDPYP